MLAIQIVLFLSIALIVFAYTGYPFSLMLLGGFVKRPIGKKIITPYISIIITAHNEELRIREKIENTLEIEYPEDKIQIIAVSEGSTDGTVGIIRDYEGRGFLCIEIEEHVGKEAAQREALKQALGDLMIFTDVATRIEPGGIKKIVSNFADPSVGCVSSEDRMESKSGGEGLYVRYEMWLRRLESNISSVIGLSGSFFAARKEFCRDLPVDIPSDFGVVLSCIKKGSRGIVDPEAIGYYKGLAGSDKEFDRKARTVLRGLTVFFQHADLLNIFRYGLISYQFLCHKLLRWCVPFFLIIAFLSNAALIFRGKFFLILFLLQILFYAVALYSIFRGKNQAGILLKIPNYFITVNLAILAAWWKYAKGDRIVMWSPSER